MENRRRLGKGLEELFNINSLNIQELDEDSSDDVDVVSTEINPGEVIEVNIDDLRPNPYQPRIKFEEEALDELAESIKEHGIFQPILVKKSIKGYDIIAGERRTRAAKKAGLEKVPVIVREITDEEMMQVALLENLQRENLTAIEEANAYKSIIDLMHITQEDLAQKLGKSRSHITNMLGLLRLSDSIQAMVLDNSLSMGHARVISKLDDPIRQEELAKKTIDEHLSVRELEELATNEVKAKPIIQRKEKSHEFDYIENYMKEKLGTKVKIGNKKMTISFNNGKDLNRILEIMNIKIED